jgi:hypothetical protein
LGGLGDEGKVVCRVHQSAFFPFYRKGLIRVLYCNLRKLVKATSPGHLRDTEAKTQYKASNVSFYCFNRQASGDHLGTEARRLELGQFPSYQHPDWE